MSKKKRFGVSQALTRGLSETIHVVENNANIYRHVVLPLSRIELDPDNPRQLAISLQDIQQGLDKTDSQYEQKSQELEKLKELAATIQKSGLINPIVAYKRGEVYRVVAGERRCLASFLAGKQDIEARIFNEKPNSFELKLLQWVENTAREDLTLVERVENIREVLIAYQQQHPTVEVTATLLKNITGLSLPQATYYFAVLYAPEDIKAAMDRGEIQNLDKAAVLANINSDVTRGEALKMCLNGCSLKDLRKFIAMDKEIQRTRKMSLPPYLRITKLSKEKIHLGFTDNTHVIKTLVHSILSHSCYQKYYNHFDVVDWNHAAESAAAFKRLIGILEQEVATELS